MADDDQPRVHTRTASSRMQDLRTRPRSVVLVHGIWDTAKIFHPLSRVLKDSGFAPLALDLKPSNGDVGLDQLAQQVAAFIEESIPTGEQFDLVGFSMGGLVSRYYVQRLGGIDRVGRLIAISSPHRGTLWAHTGANPGSRQMRPGSPFLADLNNDAAILERVNFVSIWTPFDLTIVPARSSSLGVGTEFRIPVALHPWMPKSRRCINLVVKLLRECGSAALLTVF
jgi:triacylglycerol lipase